MTKVHSYAMRVECRALDAFHSLQRWFTDQFVYYDKGGGLRALGLGRCIAVRSLDELETVTEGEVPLEVTLFNFMRFDLGNPAPCDPMQEAFPHVGFMVPEVVVIEREEGVYLQVNSLGPVYRGRIERFAEQARAAERPVRRSIPYRLELDSCEAWRDQVNRALSTIRQGKVTKVVLSRRIGLSAEEPFSSADMLANLIDGPARGCVYLYRYGDVFFCGCTPELLVRRRGDSVESMCLAGTIASSDDPAERERLAAELLGDAKNRAEHGHVVSYMREAFGRTCFDVDIPAEPGILSLPHIQHLHTPVRARLLEGTSLPEFARRLFPTPALSGLPVGEALMTVRTIEGFNRGLFGGVAGCLTASGDGEYSVAIRCGVFDGRAGWLYAGCGIVEGSDPDAEFDEIDMKMKTIRSAFEGGESHGE